MFTSFTCKNSAQFEINTYLRLTKNLVLQQHQSKPLFRHCHIAMNRATGKHDQLTAADEQDSFEKHPSKRPSFMTISPTLYQILHSRKLKSDDINPNYPIWKLRINDEEYEAIKTLLREHEHNLTSYSLEAMIFYAEWWKRDYKDGIPSKEDAAKVIGFTSKESTKKLFKVANQRLNAKLYSILGKSEGKKVFISAHSCSRVDSN